MKVKFFLKKIGSRNRKYDGKGHFRGYGKKLSITMRLLNSGFIFKKK